METVVTISPENIATITLIAIVGFAIISFVVALMRREVGA